MTPFGPFWGYQKCHLASKTPHTNTLRTQIGPWKVIFGHFAFFLGVNKSLCPIFLRRPVHYSNFMNRSAKISICRVANFNILEKCWGMKNLIEFPNFCFLFQVCFLVAVLGVNFLLVPMRPGRWNFYCFLQPSENWPGRKSEWETTYDIFLAVSSSFQGDFQCLCLCSGLGENYYEIFLAVSSSFQGYQNYCQ